MDEDELFSFNRSKRLAVISTTHATGGPEAALIGFALQNSIGLVFDTSTSSRKARNLRIQPLAAIVIGWDDGTTLQMEGTATEPLGAELEKAKELYFSIWPLEQRGSFGPILSISLLNRSGCGLADIQTRP